MLYLKHIIKKEYIKLVKYLNTWLPAFPSYPLDLSFFPTPSPSLSLSVLRPHSFPFSFCSISILLSISLSLLSLCLSFSPTSLFAYMHSDARLCIYVYLSFSSCIHLFIVFICLSIYSYIHSFTETRRSMTNIYHSDNNKKKKS